MFAHHTLKVIRYAYLLSALLGVVLIFSPIVWMEIGPNGIAYYGPQVPDIWVYGGALTGKDLGFIPLLLMMLFQFFWIIIGIVLSFVCFARWKKWPVVVPAASVSLLIILLFPSWISGYVSVIIGNSDGAVSDLTVHWTYGLWIYIAIAVLNVTAAETGLTIRIVQRLKPKMLPA